MVFETSLKIGDKTIKIGLYSHPEVLKVGSRRWLIPVYDMRAIDYIVEDIKQKRDNGFDYVLLITGDERSGKSALAAHFAVRLGMKEPRIAFSATETLDLIKETNEGEVVWMDEAGVALYSDEYFKGEERDLIKALQMVGVKRLIFIMCLPHKSLLARKVRERRVNCWIHVMAKGTRRGWARVRYPHKTEFKLDAYWTPLFVFHYSDFASYDKYKEELGIDPAKFWADYYELKLAHMESRLNEYTGKREAKNAERMISAAIALKNAGKTWEEIEKIVGLSRPYLQYLARKVGLDYQVVRKKKTAPNAEQEQEVISGASDKEYLRL